MKLLLFQGYDPILNDVISRIADYINTDSDEQPVVNGTTNDAELTVKQGVNVKGIHCVALGFTQPLFHFVDINTREVSAYRDPDTSYNIVGTLVSAGS